MCYSSPFTRNWITAKNVRCSLSGLSTFLLSSVAVAGVLPNVQKESHWFVDGQQSVMAKTKLTTRNKAKNVILFVGHGMGLSTLTAARILDGENKGNSGEEGYLSFESFPYSAQVKTYNVDAQTPDSAGTMTAMMSDLANRTTTAPSPISP